MPIVQAHTLHDGDVIIEQGEAAKIIGEPVRRGDLVAVDLVGAGNTYYYVANEPVCKKEF